MYVGQFASLLNIANRFLRIFSNLETLIRFIFPGGAGYPYLPTQLYGLLLDYFTFFVESCGLYNVFSNKSKLKRQPYLDIYTYEIGINRHTASRAI